MGNFFTDLLCGRNLVKCSVSLKYCIWKGNSVNKYSVAIGLIEFLTILHQKLYLIEVAWREKSELFVFKVTEMPMRHLWPKERVQQLQDPVRQDQWNSPWIMYCRHGGELVVFICGVTIDCILHCNLAAWCCSFF